MKTFLIGAALLAAQLTLPAAADAKRRDVPVRIADLDLDTSEGVATLDRRLAHAVLKACGTAHYLEPEQLAEVERCRADARERAATARAAILARKTSGAARTAAAPNAAGAGQR